MTSFIFSLAMFFSNRHACIFHLIISRVVVLMSCQVCNFSYRIIQFVSKKGGG